jgi:CheY-like chemotaxis protein
MRLAMTSQDRLSQPGPAWDDGRMGAPPLRVMLVDDHEVVRDGIKLLLNPIPDVVVCAEASSAREAVAVAARALPDVIVMDVRLSDGSGIEATRDIRALRPATQVLMLTSFADDEALFASIMAGGGRLRPQADQGRRAGPGHPLGRGRPESARPGGHQGGPGPPAQGQAPAQGREAGPPVPP